MNGPLHIHPSRLAAFIDGPGPVVLFLFAHPKHRFNRSLCEAFVDEDGSAVAFGQTSLADLLRSPSPGLAILHARVRASGTRAVLAVAPGYYLFRRGRMLAWHLGLPIPADAERVLRASMFGTGLAMLARNLRFLVRVVEYAAENVIAERIAARFREAAEAERMGKQETMRDAPRDELLEAYRTLGVNATASNEELVRAWRAMQHKYHPDRAGRDQAEFDRLSRHCVEINQARDTIRHHRGLHAAPHQ